MRYVILTKKQATGICAAVLSFVTLMVCSISVFANSDRLLPIYSVGTEKKQIAISFDAAWGNDDTETLIDILGKYKVKATFFVVGAWVDKYSESVKQLSSAGHQIQNHSNTHPHMTQLSTAQMIEEIKSCNEKIAKVTGKTPTLFRAPYGDYNNSVISAVDSIDMYTIQWDVETLATKVIV